MGKLTNSMVKALHEPGRYADGEGLYLRISPAGGRRWVLRIQIHHTRNDITIDHVRGRDLGHRITLELITEIGLSHHRLLSSKLGSKASRNLEATQN